MNKFLSDVGVQPVEPSTRFINPTIDPQDIHKAGTTGNELLDIVFDKSIKMAAKINNLKRENEIADLQIQSSKKLQDYELQWTTVDKYSDDHYQDYIDGLNSIYQENRVAIANTKYTTEADVLNWENKSDEDQNNSLFTQNGHKAQYDIKKTTDETLLNIGALSDAYVTTGDQSIKLQILGLYDGLEAVGVPKHTVQQLKIKSLVDNDVARIKQEIQHTLNDPNKSIEEKKESIQRLHDGFKSDALYDSSLQIAIKNNYISKDSADMYKLYAKKVVNDGWLLSGGEIDRFNSQIRDEEYRTNLQIEQEQARLLKDIANSKKKVKDALKTGDDYKVISEIEGVELSGYDLIDNATLSKKYYGATPNEILKRGEYIPTTSIYEINNLKNKARVDETNGIPRSQTVQAIYADLSNMGYDERQNIEREYMANGVVSQFENAVLNNSIQMNTSTPEEAINYAKIGSDNARYNKMGNFIGISQSSELGKATNGLDYYQRQQISEIVTGAILNGKFGALFSGKDITIGTINAQYNSSPDFKSFVDDTIRVVKSMDTNKYKKAKMKAIDYDDIIDQRYGQPIQVRRRTLESGEYPYMEDVDISLTNTY